MKIKFVILTCDRYAERQQAQRDTWLQDQNFVFLSDTPGPQTVGYGTAPDYDSMALKYIAFFKDRANFDPTQDWYYFCDDDGYVLVDNLKLHLEDCVRGREPGKLIATGFPLWFSPDKETYRSKMHGLITDIHVQYYAGGAGFAISASVVEKLFDYIGSQPTPTWCGFADVTIGYWWRAIGGVLMYDCELMNTRDWVFYGHSEAQIKGQVGYHWLSPAKMRELHEIVNS